MRFEDAGLKITGMKMVWINDDFANQKNPLVFSLGFQYAPK